MRSNTIITEPHPLSITARGGKIMQRITRKRDILYSLLSYSEKPKFILRLTRLVQKGYMRNFEYSRQTRPVIPEESRP